MDTGSIKLLTILSSPFGAVAILNSTKDSVIFSTEIGEVKVFTDAMDADSCGVRWHIVIPQGVYGEAKSRLCRGYIFTTWIDAPGISGMTFFRMPFSFARTVMVLKYEKATMLVYLKVNHKGTKMKIEIRPLRY